MRQDKKKNLKDGKISKFHENSSKIFRIKAEKPIFYR